MTSYGAKLRYNNFIYISQASFQVKYMIFYKRGDALMPKKRPPASRPKRFPHKIYEKKAAAP